MDRLQIQWTSGQSSFIEVFNLLLKFNIAAIWNDSVASNIFDSTERLILLSVILLSPVLFL